MQEHWDKWEHNPAQTQRTRQNKKLVVLSVQMLYNQVRGIVSKVYRLAGLFIGRALSAETSPNNLKA